MNKKKTKENRGHLSAYLPTINRRKDFTKKAFHGSLHLPGLLFWKRFTLCATDINLMMPKRQHLAARQGLVGGQERREVYLASAGAVLRSKHHQAPVQSPAATCNSTYGEKHTVKVNKHHPQAVSENKTKEDQAQIQIQVMTQGHNTRGWALVLPLTPEQSCRAQ